MANKHMKRYTSYVFRELKKKATMRNFYTPVRGLKSIKLTPPAADEDVNWHGHFGRQWAFSYKIKYILLPYDPAVLLLGIYPNELKPYAHAKTVHERLQQLYF